MIDDLTLFEGNNLTCLGVLEASSVTLAYLDPPFYTGKDFTTKDGRLAYTDKWDSFDQYIQSVVDCIKLIKPLLTEKGCLVLHIDPNTSHYLKCAVDQVMGRENFASEIIWRYRRWPSKTPNFQKIHDVLLRWTVGPNPTWNQLYEPLAPSTIKQWGKSKQKALITPDGKRLRSQTTKEDSPGVPFGDVWDISILAPQAKERTGYPTQKPSALLSRLIEATTCKGNLVLDPYAGSGTTLSVARSLGRRAVGIDSSSVAIETIKKRIPNIRCVPA